MNNQDLHLLMTTLGLFCPATPPRITNRKALFQAISYAYSTHVWRSSLIHHECDILSRTKCKLKANTKASVDILRSAMSEGKEKKPYIYL